MKLFVLLHLFTVFMTAGKPLPPQLRNQQALQPLPRSELLQWLHGPTLSDLIGTLDAPTITWSGDQVATITQTDVELVGSILVDVSGLTEGPSLYNGLKNAKPKYSYLTLVTQFLGVGLGWEIRVGAQQIATNASDGNVYPPLTGWVNTDGILTSISYSTIWVVDGDFATLTKADLLDHYNNRNGSMGLWVQATPGGDIIDVATFIDDNRTLTEVNINDIFFKGTSGALKTTDGATIVDSNGYVLFTM
jgi:hypothetical protein